MSDLVPYRGIIQLRSHQERARLVALEMAVAPRKTILADVYPGAGKTVLAAIFADTLIRLGLIDYVLVITPRRSLCSQMSRTFRNEDDWGVAMGLLDDPSKSMSQRTFPTETVGYVTTFHALVDDTTKKTTKKLADLLKRMKNGKWLVIIDEVHHCSEDADDAEEPLASAWSAAAKPLVDRATHVLLMSGTLRRHDRQPISFIGKYVDNLPPQPDIVCTLEQALLEKMILPIRFRLIDADVSWRDRYGKRHDVSLRDAKQKQLGEAMRHAVGDPAFREDSLDEAVEHWKQYRETEYRSRMIVICHERAAATSVHNYLTGIGIESVLAISKSKKGKLVVEAEDGNVAIGGFRGDRGLPRGDVLVTVGMAHEGLDVPDCTHMVILRNNKSGPWWDQAINRVTRVNHKAKRLGGQKIDWEDQVGFVFMLDNQTNRTFVNKMKEAADNSIAMKGHRGPVEPKGFGVRGESLGSKVGEVSEAEGGHIPPTPEQRIVAKLDRRCPQLSMLPFVTRLETAREFGITADEDAAE